ncbi:efflux transporter outer membrane subunit [Xanthomonas albilineans]|uniref:efflux transporter outer membrane subunit n=1 Tax=Xanthomonas albilineans TaxID=29447 RepID=UPI0005F35640|nr:efflux transporter outer membrane subunit [Xanthomonas albilineans]
MSTRRIASALLSLALLGGCRVGPDFVRPPVPAVDRYTAAPLPPQTAGAADPAGAAQHLLPGEAVPARWWSAFASPALDMLVDAALQANPDLQAADAALRAANETAAAQLGSLAPAVDLQVSPQRQRQAGGSPYTLHTAQVNVSYVLDVFGGNRRQHEVLAAQAEVQRFQRQAAYMSLTSNVVASAIQEAGLRAQIDAAQAQIALAQRLRTLLERQYAAGQASGVDLAAQDAALAQAQAVLPPLQQQLAQQRARLAVLAGRPPSEDIAQRFALGSLRLPTVLPLSLPAQVLARRADVAAAQAQLHAACAQIGVATAARLPSLSLSGNIGSSAAQVRQLFERTSAQWLLGGELIAPLFHGGSLRHQQRAAVAAYDQAQAQYRSVVLAALQDTANTLQALLSDAQTLQAAVAARTAAARSLALAQRQHALGAGSGLQLLQAEQVEQQAVIALVQAQTQRYADTVALFQALGGAPPAADDPAPQTAVR